MVRYGALYLRTIFCPIFRLKNCIYNIRIIAFKNITSLILINYTKQ